MLFSSLLHNIIVLTLVVPAQSSHFLGGTITWRIVNASIDNTSIVIRLSQTYSFTYASAGCNSVTIAQNQPASASPTNLACSPLCPSSFGLIPTQVYCTDASLAGNIGVGQRSDVVVLPIGSNFSATFISTAWSSPIGGGAWSIGTRINLARRPDNGLFNNAPIVTVVSPIIIYPNERKIFTLAIKDPDDDEFRCRWSSPSNGGVDECASVCALAAVPPNTTLYSNCTVETIGTTVGQEYAFAIMVGFFSAADSRIFFHFPHEIWSRWKILQMKRIVVQC